MTPRQTIEATPPQMARLRRIMQRADAEWEEVTRSIQTDQQRLAALQQRLEHFRLLRAVEDEPLRSSPSLLSTQVQVLEQQIAALQHQLCLERAQRCALAQQFDQARLALAALRRSTPKKGFASTLARTCVFCCIGRPIQWLWLELHRSAVPPAAEGLAHSLVWEYIPHRVISRGVTVLEASPHTFTQGRGVIERAPHTFSRGTGSIEQPPPTCA